MWFFLVASEGWKNRKIANCIDGDTELYGFGTFFSSEGFFDEALSGICESGALEKIQDVLFGHYCVLVSTRSQLQIVRDRVGMEDVYYKCKSGSIVVSNSMIVTALSFGGIDLNAAGVRQFVFRGSTIGNNTLFLDVHRMSFSNTLVLTSRGIEFKTLSATPPIIGYNSYKRRIEEYFSLINFFAGRMIVDISAGFDTRTIASIADQGLNKFCLVANENTSDGGVDVKIAREVACRLDRDFHLVRMDKSFSNSFEQRIFLHDCARDLFSARMTLFVAKEVQKLGDLQIGGYGGEVIRAKYTKIGSWYEFANKYYGSRVARRLGMDDTFARQLEPELRSIYQQQFVKTGREVCRWLYSMDRMRIWGGARNRIRSHFIDNLHPFMDWHLLGPLLTWPFEDLDDGKLQYRLVKDFSPKLYEVPINPTAKELGMGSTVSYNRGSKFASILRSKLSPLSRKDNFLLRRKLDAERSREFEEWYVRIVNSPCFRDIETATGLRLNYLIRSNVPLDWSERFLSCLVSYHFVKKHAK